MDAAWINHEGDKVRQDFLRLLASRHTRSGLLTRIPGGGTDLKIRSCSNGGVNDFESRLEEEHFYLVSEEGEQGRVPVLVLKPVRQDGKSSERRPVVVLLHSTGRSKETMRPYMEDFAARGYIAVAIDCRYHGERAVSVDSYSNALISAWRTGKEMPFIFDTVWDLIAVVDYLSAREDVDPARIGMLGISLGGMHSWFAAVADPRVAVVVPIICVQNFSWAVNNEMWQGRVGSIPHAFEVAKEDLGKPTVDAETVAAVWQRIAPGLMDRFDAEHSIPAIAPRPLLVLNGELDPRCPLQGLDRIVKKASETYEIAGFPNHFKFKVENGIDHIFSEVMRYDASVWIDKFLKPDQPLSAL